jgi:hypothetical protein
MASSRAGVLGSGRHGSKWRGNRLMAQRFHCTWPPHLHRCVKAIHLRHCVAELRLLCWSTRQRAEMGSFVWRAMLLLGGHVLCYAAECLREPRICCRTAQPPLPPSAWGTCWWALAVPAYGFGAYVVQTQRWLALASFGLLQGQHAAAQPLSAASLSSPTSLLSLYQVGKNSAHLAHLLGQVTERSQSV